MICPELFELQFLFSGFGAKGFTASCSLNPKAYKAFELRVVWVRGP